MATNLGGEDNENDYTDVEFDGSKFEDRNHWLQEAND